MAARRVWDALSASYRRRLEKGGITRESYEGGVSLKAARGHGTTPENIREYQKNPGKFKQYRERRKDIADRVIAKKKEAFEHTLRWNEGHAKQYVRRGERGFIRPPTMKQLRFIDGLSVEELIEYQYRVKDEDDWRFLWYH